MARKNPPYMTIKAECTICPDCEAQPKLLIQQEGGSTGRNVLPSFYVCQCGFIGQIGVGRVPHKEL